MSKLDYLNEKITKRANEAVQKDIENFCRDVNKAFQGLFHNKTGTYVNHFSPRDASLVTIDRARQCLELLLTSEKRLWPSSLWREEEKRVTEAVMGVLDPLQRVLAAQDIEGGEQAAPETVEDD